MRIIADRLALSEAFAAVAGVIPARSPKPILQNVKFTCTEDDRATLLATDLEVGIRHRVVGAVGEPGSAILSPRVGQILKLSTDSTVGIEVVGEKIVVTSGRSTWELPSEDPDLFPNVPDFDATDLFTVTGGPLRSCIRRTVFATDPESTRYALGGVLWEFDESHMIAVATDGRRLARSAIDVERVGNPGVLERAANGSGGAPVVPARALKLVDRLIGGDEELVSIAVGSNHVLLQTDDAVIYSRLVEGRFPKYQDAFPDRPASALTMPAADLLLGVRQAGILTSEDSRGVDFQFAAGELVMSAQAADVGSSNVHVPMPGDGVGFVVTMDPVYVVPMLAAIPAETEVTIRLTDPKSPIQVDGPEGYSYVIMPLTRDR